MTEYIACVLLLISVPHTAIALYTSPSLSLSIYIFFSMQRMKSTHQSYCWAGLERFPIYRAHIRVLAHRGTPTLGCLSLQCTPKPALSSAAACPLAPFLEGVLTHGLRTPTE